MVLVVVGMAKVVVMVVSDGRKWEGEEATEWMCFLFFCLLSKSYCANVCESKMHKVRMYTTF